MNTILSVTKEIDQKVKEKNNPFIMMGQSCVEWIRIISESKYNFVPQLKALKISDRIEPNVGDSNIMNFEIGVICIFNNSIFAKQSSDNEKKFPSIKFYIGNNAIENIKSDHKDSEEKKIIVYINVNDSDCNIEQNNVDNWQLPRFYSIDNLDIIESNSSQIIYFGYLYIMALSLEQGFNISLILNGNFTVEKTIEILSSYVKANYSHLTTKN